MGEEADALCGLVEAGIEECENYFRDRRSTIKRPHGKMAVSRKSEVAMSKLTAAEKKLLEEAIRIASEDGSIYRDDEKVDEVNAAIKSIQQKLGLRQS